MPPVFYKRGWVAEHSADLNTWGRPCDKYRSWGFSEHAKYTTCTNAGIAEQHSRLRINAARDLQVISLQVES